MKLAALAARAALAALAACSGAHPRPAAERVGPVLAAALAAADHMRAPWRCAAEDLPAPDAPAGWHAAAHGLARDGTSLVLGVVADAGGAASETLAALGRLRARMETAHVDAIVALGGMGSDERDLEATLGVLALPRAGGSAVPLIAMPGDLESAPAEQAALAALRAKGATAIDGRLARWITTSSATLATLPGASVPVAGADGCAWTPADATRIYAELAAQPGVRVALVAGAPREVSADTASGELALVPGPAIDLVVHGPTSAAPSPERSGGRDGTRASVSPGTSDAAPRLPGAHAPAAGVLAVRGGAWSWSPLVDK